jgi:hypothetical protein
MCDSSDVSRCNLSDPACTPGTHEFETAAARVRNVLAAYKAKTKQHLEAGVSGSWRTAARHHRTKQFN